MKPVQDGHQNGPERPLSAPMGAVQPEQWAEMLRFLEWRSAEFQLRARERQRRAEETTE